MTEFESVPNDSLANSTVKSRGRLKATGASNQIQFYGIAILVVSLLPLLSDFSSVFELFSHFRLQMLIVSVAISALLLIFKSWRYLIPAVVAVVLNASAIYPLYFGTQARASVDNFRLITMNASVTNQDFEWIYDCIKAANPDVICVQELSPELNEYLAKTLTDYPHRLVDPRKDPFGIGIYSRLYVNSQVLIPSESIGANGGKLTINAVKVGITFGDQNVDVVSAHPPPPLTQEFADWRNRELSFIADIAAKSQNPVIIAGDFNCTAYSPIFSKILKQGKLHDSEIGFGIQPTWPNNMLPLVIPIDHVLYKGPIKIVDRRLGSNINSDHTPVVVSFRIGNRE